MKKILGTILVLLLLTGCNASDVEYFGESYYGIKGNEIVYTYRGHPKDISYTFITLQDVLKETFEVIMREDGNKSFLAQDEKQLYCSGLVVTNIEKESLRLVNENNLLYVVDNHGVYLVDEKDCVKNRVEKTTVLEKIEGADVQTIQHIYKGLFKDANNYYFKTSSELTQTENYEVLSFFEYESFDEQLAIRSDLYWLKDKHRVVKKVGNELDYEIVIEDTSNEAIVSYFGDTFYLRVNNDVYFRDDILGSIKNVDEIRVVGDQIITDGVQVFHGRNVLHVDEATTFEHLQTNFYKDSGNIYYFNQFRSEVKKVMGINITKATVINDYLIKDDKNYFYLDEKIEGLDYNSFEELKGEAYRDKDNYFYKTIIAPVKHYDSFTYCDQGLGYDFVYIYHYDTQSQEFSRTKIKDADEGLKGQKESLCSAN